METKIKLDKDKAKRAVGRTASTTVKVTMTVVKLIFVIIIAYTIFISVYLFLTTNREQFLTNIATISVGGFWAFFLGYFGWRMGQTIEHYFVNIKRRR